ncbi:MAG: creatininase family protein [Cucumibacter sp.]
MPLKFFDDVTDPSLAAFVGARTVGVLPVAATEPHGPHLPTTTDCDIARGHLASLRNYLPPDLSVAILPLQEVGYSIEHAAFPGLRNREPEELLADWGEIAADFHRVGGRRLVIVSSHGGNSPVVDILIRRLRVRLAMLAIGTAWMRFGQPEGLFDNLELQIGIHGGDIETSLMLHYAPEKVRTERWQKFTEFAPTNTEVTPFGPHRFGWMSQDLNPYGVVGNAAAATAEKGAASARQALEGFAKLLTEAAAFDLELLRPAGEIDG